MSEPSTTPETEPTSDATIDQPQTEPTESAANEATEERSDAAAEAITSEGAEATQEAAEPAAEMATPILADTADPQPDTEAAAPAEAEAKPADPEPEAAAEEPVTEAAPPAEAEVKATDAEPEAADAEPVTEAAPPAEAEAKATDAEPEAADAELVTEAAPPAEAEAKAIDAEPEAADAEPVAEAAPPAEAEAPEKAADKPASVQEPAAKAETSADDGPAETAEGGKKPAPDKKAAVPVPLDPALEPLVVAMETKAPIEGKVIGWNKGGYHVALGKIAAFCPVSQIEIGNPRAPKRYLDRPFKFIVIDVAKDGRRVVVSRADALKAERKEKAAKVREVVKIGAVFEGKIRSLTEFGAFVTLEQGIEGLVHISELSRRRVDHPKELVSVGQEVKVKVLKVEKGGERISLSMKRLEADPWKTLRDRFPTGSEFTGTVKRKAEFGLFVEVEPGIEGLVHTSRLPHGKSLEDESVAEGATVTGWVQEVEPRRRRLALSLRPVPNAKVWDGVEERFSIGNIIEGTVERVADFGAFIELEPGLTGLLPFSELWGSKGPGGGGGGGGGANFKRQYHAGKKVTVRILSIDIGRKRISLGTEASKAVGTQADYRDYKKQKDKSSSLGAMAAAFAKVQDQGSSSS